MSRSIDFVTLLVGKLAYLHSVDTSRQLYRVPGLHCNHHNKGGEERNRVKSQVEGGTFHKLGTTPPQLLLQSDANFTLDRGIFEDIERQRIWKYGGGVVMVTGNMCTVSGTTETTLWWLPSPLTLSCSPTCEGGKCNVTT